jgi:hypothetical protein
MVTIICSVAVFVKKQSECHDSRTTPLSPKIKPRKFRTDIFLTGDFCLPIFSKFSAGVSREVEVFYLVAPRLLHEIANNEEDPMSHQELNPRPFKKSETREKEFDNQKSDSTSRTTNAGLKPDDQKKNQAPRTNELYEEELPPESRVVSQPL